ncbi:zinc ribbon domain-containing protein [Halonotius terrestris]|uniref:Zinc ribbon domain-containing protein n=1 Tax=Halonotius terrestris TaxID=2487750 RepID=A0A8J8P9F2_9EURY|nr:zinc ribbon domain-containing protein [Halonotius terrestris]TQQ81060.1 zinc ribbon domain-containing protein [Halonotius terrestris]
MGNSRRVLVTALVAIAGAMLGVAGAGHAYLRRWRRSLLWLTVTIGAGVLLINQYVPNPGELDPFDTGALPTEVTLPLFVIIAISVFDATLLAYLDERNDGGDAAITADAVDDEGGVSCPHCGKTTDAELDFCTWCTEPLTTADDNAAADSDPQSSSEFDL